MVAHLIDVVQSATTHQAGAMHTCVAPGIDCGCTVKFPLEILTPTRSMHVTVVVFIHNIPVRFVNQLKLKGLSRSHPVHVATAAVVTDQHRMKEKRERKGSGGK